MKKIFGRIAICAIALLLGAGLYVHHSLGLIPKLFKLNGQLQTEGYYMAEFEFKMVGVVYYIDKGRYLKALTTLNRLHRELTHRTQLVKLPRFRDKNQEFEFYLNLQNPRTGAFMDDDFPLGTYVGPTLNVIAKLELLAEQTGRPLKLKYPLRFLDRINTPATLRAYLDDLAEVGWLASKLPKTPYILAFEIVYYPDLERVGAYRFSPAWQRALREWYYANQDSRTGYWGPRRHGRLLAGGDLVATAHIIRLYVDDEGRQRQADFPLRHSHQMFATTLEHLAAPMPRDLSRQHDWALTGYRGLRLLSRFLWPSLSPAERRQATAVIERMLTSKFELGYLPAQGAFRYYADSPTADLDGTGENLDMLDYIGAWSSARRARLWGPTASYLEDLGQRRVSRLRAEDFAWLGPAVNSIRVYQAEPRKDYLAGVSHVCYPRPTPVPDILDLLPRVESWLNATPRGMGNWISKESIRKTLTAADLQTVAVRPDLALAELNAILSRTGRLTVVGCDRLQRPRVRLTFVRPEAHKAPQRP